MPHDPRFPVVCMDESSKQLVGEVTAPIPLAPGHGQILDHEYVRNGVATLFVAVEPLAGRRHVEVTERRTRQDWAHFIKALLTSVTPERSRSAWSWTISTPTTSPRFTTLSRQPKHAAWPNGSKSISPQARQLAEHRRDRTECPRRPVLASSHSGHRVHAARGRGLAAAPQPARRPHQLALHHQGCPHQTLPPLSETIAVTGYQSASS